MKNFIVNIEVDATYSVEVVANSSDEAYEKARNRGFVRNEDMEKLDIQEIRVATVVDDETDQTEEYY